jgi:hypothetical protein
MILPAGCWSAQTPKEPAAGAAAAAGTVFFAINGAILKTFLFNTGVGRIAIVEISCAIVACIPSVVAWITLKKSSSSNLALLAAAGIATVGLPIFPFNSHPVRSTDRRSFGLDCAPACSG